MNKLREFYIHCMATVALVVALATYLIPTHFLPELRKAGKHEWLILILENITNRFGIVVILGAAEYIVRKRWWKIMHPELDFSGKWIGYTGYTNVHVGTVTNALPQLVRQEVIFVQDCLNLRLVTSEGKNFNFKSRTIDIQDGGRQLVYAYEVEYFGNFVDRPKQASYGYEWLNVVKTPEGKRPQKLSGHFAHCANGQQPVFSGEVHLYREGIGFVPPPALAS